MGNKFVPDEFYASDLLGDIAYYIITFFDIHVNFFGEIYAAQMTFCLDLKPVQSTLSMVVVLRVAWEDNNIILRFKAHHAD